MRHGQRRIAGEDTIKKHKAMKLAEALQRRADIRTKIDDLKDRMEDNVLIQENDEPDFDMAALMEEHDALVDEWVRLVAKINETNSTACDPESGKTIAELLVDREAAKIMKQTYEVLTAKTSERAWRSKGSEIKVVSAIKAKETQKKVDSAAKKFRETDNKIQQLNWSTDLKE